MDQQSEVGPDPRPGRLRLALAAQAEADTLRARRAERLARIRAGLAAGQSPDTEEGPGLPAEDDVEALERFLAGLVGTIASEPAPPQPTPLAPVLPLVRPGASAGGDASDLARLPGAGPGLVGALIRGGVPDLAALAGLGRDTLGQKLGPLARLIDLDAWLAFARAATDQSCGPVPQDLTG